MERELFDKICDDIDDRKEWANRQPLWHKLRRDGIRRINKPHANASDKHFPLIDMAIKKLKPTMTNQMFAMERLADFVAKDPRDTQDITAVSWWFDFKLKENSNLLDEMDILSDYKYSFGHGIMKVYWDHEEGRLAYDAIAPIFIIVPDGTKDLQHSEYLVHVKHLTKWDYKHGPDSSEYKQEEDFVKKITGDHSPAQSSDEGDYHSARRTSDGITHSTDEDVIIVWEVFERKDAKTIMVHTISPLLWEEDIREPFELSYRNAKIPFIDFPQERIDKSFYSSRGIPELGAAFQSYLCKCWNAKSDHMDMWNNPPLTATKEIPFPGNVKTGPGCIIPFPVTPISMPAPAISWDTEMANTRDLAEQHFSVPDFGIGEKGFDSGKKKSTDRTATETNYLASITNVMMDAQSRIDRKQQGKLYNQSWDLLFQFDEDMGYLHKAEFQELDKELRDKVHSLRPSGNVGAWNTTQRLQRALMRMQTFIGNPHINQGELVKMTLEMDEPGLVDRLYQDPGVEQQNQLEEQAKEIPALGEGFPIKIDPRDDHFIHAQAIMEYVLQGAVTGRTKDPHGQQQIMRHLNEHVQAGMQVDSKRMGALVKQFQQASQAALAAQGVSVNGQGQPTKPKKREPEPSKLDLSGRGEPPPQAPPQGPPM